MDNVIRKLTSIELDSPFPYRDTDKIQVDFRSDFMKLTDDKNFLTGDFNTFCMNIAGTLSYVLAGRTGDIPQRQIEKLQLSFFNWFQQYKFIEDRISDYEEFCREYKNFEEARMLLLKYLSKRKRD
ncbi:YxiJ family protein [Paenibacillus sp. Soil522]|uniref:YxiJ family protein n=1 Tax=Paenibacillus sp. Soil522 TaxID=1736388 RepID=UPI0006F3477B|nr:YxiJ family protein [Paenibacillus sp. Soil522]KRE21305.1 hypothetical protein ASG81_29405 [Paenibacillus sp. Soil522]